MSMGHNENDSENDEPFWSSNSSNENSNSSSTGSWIDEYEEYITKDLKDQYEKFEAALYSEVSLQDLPKSMQEEVKIWKEYAPHIRVRGTQIKPGERPGDFTEDGEEDDLEEVLASHGTFEEMLERSLSRNDGMKKIIENCKSPVQQNSIKSEIKEAVVNTLFQQAWPNVLKKAEPVLKSISQTKEKHGNKDRLLQPFDEDSEDQEDDTVPPMEGTLKFDSKEAMLGLPRGIGVIRSSSSKSHVRSFNRTNLLDRNSAVHRWLLSNKNNGALNDYSWEPENIRCLLSGNVGQRTSHTAPRQQNRASAPRPPQTSKKILTEPKKPQNSKNIVLPPIETLAITPKKIDKRANSAMVRFTKTLPRINRPNTSKRNNMLLAPIKTKRSGKENMALSLNGSLRGDERSLTKSSNPTKTSKAENKNRWNY